ncbi:MAG TPA: hypothetical protein VM077_01120 [Candidatus Limnocylindrales bacterium]|nr:hypothetical protein [Candidatus Limnocylindrales bacterium]
MIKVKKRKSLRICQGDIYKNINLIEFVSEKNGVIEVSKIDFPYVVVLTQDCELQQDFNFRKGYKVGKEFQNKMLLSVLVAPIYNAEHVYLGQHLSDLDIQASVISKTSTKGKFLRKNEIPRYHFLNFPEEIPISDSIVDFKHYFSVNVEYLRKLKKMNFVCKVSELYREDLSLRFANYLSRIGLPELI